MLCRLQKISQQWPRLIEETYNCNQQVFVSVILNATFANFQKH